MTSPQETEPLKIGPEPIGFTVSAKKFWLMSIFTCFLYTRYWAYKQFRHLPIGRLNKFTAILCALFLPISFFSLMSGLEKNALEQGIELKFDKKVVASVSFFILCLITRFMETLVFSMAVSAISTSLLFRVQRKINATTALVRPDIQPDSKFSALDFTGMAITATLLALLAIIPRLPSH